VANNSPGNAIDLDLSSRIGFAQTTEWLRNHVLLEEEPSAPMLELNVRVATASHSAPERRVSIFVDTADAYLVAFRGKDAVYVLYEKGRDVASKLAASNLVATGEPVVLLDSIGTSHRSLGTFRILRKGNTQECRTFAASDLLNAGKIASFSAKTSEVTHDELRDALSLLVCMTSESARSRTVQIGFDKIYLDARVQPDTVMQSYDQAKRLTYYAERFPDYGVAQRVERLEKRAHDLRDLADAAQAAVGRAGDSTYTRDFFDHAIRGTTPRTPPALAGLAKRARDFADELNQYRRDLPRIEAADLLAIITLCSNQDALRAAKDGVIVPPIKAASRGA